MNDNYTLITVLGAVASCIFAIISISELIEFRFEKKASYLAIWIYSVFHILMVLAIYNRFGSATGGQLYMIFGTIPPVIFFFIISLYRDGRLFFCFFAVQIILLTVIDLTNLIDSFFPTKGHMVHSILRIVLFPALFFLIRRYISGPYHQIQSLIYTGWNKIAVISGLFYILLVYTYNYPALLYERPSDIPIFLLIIVIAFCYLFQTISILYTIQEKHELEKRETLFAQTIDSIKSRIRQTEIAEKQLSRERHDLHHRYNTILSLLNKQDIDSAAEYVNSSALHLEETRHPVYCENAIICATIEIYAALAGDYGISLDLKLDIPKELPVSSEELSVVFANALENAINAAKLLPEGKRFIRIKCISRPNLMLQIKNPVSGHIRFDRNGIPVTDKKGHGVGIWSIEQYC